MQTRKALILRQVHWNKLSRAGEKKAIWDNDVLGDVFKLLGENDLRIMTQLIKNIYKNGKWPKEFSEVTMTALKKKQKVKKCSNHHTISLITHTAKSSKDT